MTEKLTDLAKRLRPFLVSVSQSVASDVTTELTADFYDHVATPAASAHTGGVGDHNHQDTGTGGLLDHGLALTGLGDDDHPHYLNTARHDVTARHSLGTVVPHDDHGLLSGLGDDDHLQYFRVDGTRGMSGHMMPTATDTYDLGSSTLLWRKGWLSEMDAILFAENTISVIGGWFYITKDQGALPTALSAAATSYNFGKAMTPGDFVVFRGLLMVEYIQIGALVSGTTYNITRNLDGTGANNWPAGAVYAVLGASGQGRIELNAYDTPRISIVEQGATYNAQTERIRLGDLAAWQAAGLSGYGMAMGDFAGGEYLYYTPGSGLVVRGTLRADDGYLGNLDISGTLRTAASPNPRIELSNTQLAGYSDETTRQFWISAADGRAYAGNGAVRLSADGIDLQLGEQLSNQIRWLNGASEMVRIGCRYDGYEGSLLISMGSTVMLRTRGANYVDIPVGINVGSVTGAWPGEVRTSGKVRAFGGLESRGHDGGIFVPLNAPIRPAAFNGNSFSTTGKTAITVSSTFGLPADTKALYCRVNARDSASANTSNIWFGLSPNSVPGSFSLGVSPRGLPNDYYFEQDGICTVMDDTIYYQVQASGTNTMDITIDVHGYFV